MAEIPTDPTRPTYDPFMDRQAGWESTNYCLNASRRDGLLVFPSAEDDETPLHFVACMTYPDAKASGCGHPGSSIKLEATSLRKALHETGRRWPFREAGAKVRQEALRLQEEIHNQRSALDTDEATCRRRATEIVDLEARLARMQKPSTEADVPVAAPRRAAVVAARQALLEELHRRGGFGGILDQLGDDRETLADLEQAFERILDAGFPSTPE